MMSCQAKDIWPMYRHDINHSGRSPYACPETPTLKWRFDKGTLSSPAIGNKGILYVGSYDERLYAIKSDGALKWSYATGGSIDSSPAIDKNGTVYVASYDGKLYAFNSDGTVKWSIPIVEKDSFRIYSSPAISSNEVVYIGSPDGLYAIGR
jgi:outer membrane protein assembly factor BamB